MFFFFFKQKTAYEIKECDWSSDVCSSDLGEWFSHKDCKNCWVEDPCIYCYSLNVPPSRETVLPSELFCETLKGTVEGVLTALLFLKKEGYLPLLLQKLPELL